MAIHIGTGVVAEGRIGHHIEGSGQNGLSHHILECLASLLQTVTLKTVTEYLMKEDTAGRTRENGRACIWIGDWSLLQGS